jgi:hypothetical protein
MVRSGFWPRADLNDLFGSLVGVDGEALSKSHSDLVWSWRISNSPVPHLKGTAYILVAQLRYQNVGGTSETKEDRQAEQYK